MASKLNDWKEQANSGAAPEGVGQAARAAEAYENAPTQGPGQSQSSLGKWTSEAGYVNQSKSWYTGANQDGTNNGWDTGFAQKFIDGQNLAAKEKRLGTYFEGADATGVVTWDHTSTKGDTEFKFGDIYEDGKKTGNIYDQFDRKTADLMMTDWLFDAKAKAKMFGASDAEDRIGREVESKRERNNIEIPKSLQAAEFGEKVEKTEEEFNEGVVDEAIVGGGALATGMIGAGIGSVVPVVGTIAGGIGGAIFGGVAAAMNKDQLTEMAARSYEITAMATNENGLTSGIFEGVHQWSGFAGKLMSPISNTVQGAYDIKAGSIGDGDSEFYRVDEEGKRKVGTLWKGADIVGSMGDALLQFSNPVGLTMYSAQMTGAIGGQVGGLITSGGETFDDRQGGFDNIFTDDKGNTDWGSAAAGIASIGIDVVQLGMARGLAGKADRSMAAIGMPTTYNTGRLTAKLPTWAGGRTAEAKAALAAGGKEVEAAGVKFTLDAGGAVVSQRKTLSLLAPSEQLANVSARAIARRTSAADAGATKADDFYRAAQSLATGERKLTNAIVNGFGEGYEEALQAVFEPLSHNASVDAREVISAALYGGAMGVGMSMGTSLHTSNADQKMYAQALATYTAQTGGAELSRREWDGMTDIQKRVLASRSGIEDQVMQAAYKKVIDDQAHEMNSGVIGAAKLQDAIQSQLTRSMASLTDRTDSAIVIEQLEDAGRFDGNGQIRPTDAYTMPSNAVGASAWQTVENIRLRLEGYHVQRSSIQRTIGDLQAEDQADPDVAERLASQERLLAEIEDTLDAGIEIVEDLTVQLDRVYADTATPASIEADVAVINQGLRMLFDEVDESGALTAPQRRARARAVSLLLGRDPHDSSGSYQVLVPQVSVALTMERANNVLQVSHAVLPSIRGDFDGDKMRQLNQLILDDTEFVNLRSGAHYIGAGGSVNVPAMKYEADLMDKLALSLRSNNRTLSTFAVGMLTEIGTTIRNRYDGAVDMVVLDRVLEDFFAAARSGAKDARATLMDGLANKLGGEITEFSRGKLSNEWLWIDQVIRSTMQQFQEAYAAHRPDIGDPVDSSYLSPSKRTESVREVKASEAATYGQTMGQVLAGDSMFRKFQKLHYTSGQAPVLSADNPQHRARLAEMAQFYEALGQDMTTSELEAIRSKDAITGRVYAQLARLAQDGLPQEGLNPAQAMAVIANMQVQDFDIDRDGNVTPGKVISLTQLLLKRSVSRDRREKEAVFDASPELQAKHARLLAMTTPGGRGDSNPMAAERAFVEVFGSQQLFSILGDDAFIFGPHLTVEQFVREYSSKSEVGRRRLTKQLRSEPMYLGKKQAKDMPYSLQDVRDKDISPYRSVVDAIVGVGNKRIAIDMKTGKLTGEVAEKSDRSSAAFQDAHGQVRQALMKFAGLSPRQEGELTPALVQRMLESRPDFARQVMGLIPNASANAVFEIRGDEVWISNWVYETFTIRDATEAEMHYWRNLLIAEWNALGHDATDEAGVEGENARRYDRLPRRMHRILYTLAQEAKSDGGLRMAQFLKELESAKSVESFMDFINRTPGFRGEQAPLTAWVDDVAEFDMDKAQGGWTTALQGAELREAIASLQVGSRNLVKSLTEEQMAWDADLPTLQAIRRVIRFDRGDQDVVLDAGDRAAYNAMEKVVEMSGELATGLGPQAILFQTMGAVRGFYPQAHTKGTNPDNVEVFGLHDAWRDAFDYVTNYERVVGSLTSLTLDAVGGNLGQVAKDAGRTMDDHGRPVTWVKPTVENMLDLLEAPDTRPLARAVLFPQVMERTQVGSLQPQMLMGKSLKGLLDGTTMKSLFPKNDRLSQDSAMRYVSMLNAQALRFGGHNAFVRALNDYVIAQTSAASTVMSDYDLEQAVTRSIQDLAMLLQGAGSMASRAGWAASVKNVKQLARKGAKETARKNQMDVGDQELESFITMREEELQAEINELLDLATQNPTDALLLEKQIEMARTDHASFVEKAQFLRDDDQVGSVVAMFSIPVNPAEGAAKKSAIVDYIDTHRGIFERASSAAIVFQKLSSQMLDSGRNGQLDLTDKEWELLSRVVIADYLTQASGRAGNNLSVSPFPDADHSADHRYYDTSFSYLLDPILDPSSPLLLAARELHLMAGRHEVVATESDMLELLDRTLFKDFKTGRWTDDIVRASIEANQRLDSSAAAPAIAMAGNAPKRQAVISAATRRTFLKPDESMLSTVRLNTRLLDRPLYDDIAISMPGETAAALRPLAQLNNRFASSVMATLPDGTQHELLFRGSLGRVFQGNDSAAQSGYYEVSVDRLHTTIVDLAAETGVSPGDIQVEMKFFHPDTQPAGAEWFNNLYFEGTSFSLDADVFSDLNSTLFFSSGGISPAAQAAALDASKLGMAALQVIPAPSAATREEIESVWTTDLASVLREKTRVTLETDMGFGLLDPEFYNAIHKNMKLRHFVRGELDDVTTLWTAEQVIDFQRTNPGTPLPLDNATLWVPSDDVLRSMLGEQGTQGVARVFDDQLDFDLANVPTYRGVTETMLQRFAPGIHGQEARLEETRLAHRAHQAQFTVRAMLSEKERAAYDLRIQFLKSRQDDVWGERAEFSGGTAGSKFSTTDNLTRALRSADGLLRAENIALDWSAAGIPFIGPRVPGDTALSKLVLKDLERALDANNDSRTGWVYREGFKDANLVQGQLTQVNLTQERKGMRVAPGDLVVVEVDSFDGDGALGRKRLDYFTNNGAIVVLGNGDGRADLRAELGIYLEANGYSRVAGSKHVYQPADYGSRFQNVKARASTLLETRGVSTRNMLSVFNIRGREIEENSAWVNPDNERLGAIGVTMNLVPTNAFAGYNVPVESLSYNTSQIEAIRQHLRGLNTSEGREFLADMGTESVEDPDARTLAKAEFLAAYDRMIQRFDATPGVVLPQAGDEFGTGDMIPLINQQGHVLLYRHGYKAPKNREQIDEQQARPRPGSIDANNVAVYSAVREPQATTHSGTVVGFNTRSGYGLSVELNIPLQVFGDKKQLQWNGMKYLLTPKPKSLVTPGHGILGDWGIDIIASIDDAISKESVDGMVNNHRNAFAFFGIDFLPDMMKFFGLNEANTRELLRTISTGSERLTLAAADELLSSQRVHGTLTEMLMPMSAAAQKQFGSSKDWLQDLSQGTVEAQIAKAMLVYLMIPGTQVSDVLTSGSFADESSSVDAQSRLMPRLFTQQFDEGSPELRQEMNKRFNRAINNTGPKGTGYRLLTNWQFETRNEDPGKNLVGFLQYAEAHSSGDNPFKNGMSFDETSKGAVSQHSAAVAYQAIGAETAARYDLARARLFTKAPQRFERDAQDGGVWRMLTTVGKGPSFASWRMDTPAEAERRSLARDAMVQFRQEINQSEGHGWSPKQMQEYLALTQKIVRQLGLQESQAGMVDGWVRQHLGMPAGQDVDGNELGLVSGKQALEVADDIRWNVENGYLPTIGAEVPLLDLHDLQALYRVSQLSDRGWKPRVDMSDKTVRATSWDDWVKVSLGGSFTSDNLFDPLYSLALDGFMHTYQNSTQSLMDLPVSMDALIAEKLLLPENNRRMLTSLDPRQQQLITEPAQLDIQRADLAELLGGQRIAGRYKGVAAPATEVAKRRAARRRWRAENGVPIPLDVTMRNFRKNGAEFVDHSTTTNALVRSLINLRVGTALINPALWISMGPEAFIRGTIDRMANTITGQSTTGTVSRVLTRFGESIEDTTMGELLEAAGITSRYSIEVRDKLATLYNTLGQRSDFKGMIFRDLNFLRPHQSGIGRIEKALEGYAKFGSKMQDPTYGVRATTLARRYVEAALEHIEARPTFQPITVDTLIAAMETDPMFLQNNYPEAHRAASAAVAQARSLKQTLPAIMLRSVYEPLSESTNAAVNIPANILLKLPMLFSGYAMNVVTTITGLQGLNDFTAMWLQGREKYGWVQKAQAAMRGITLDEYQSKYGTQLNMDETIEGIDLSRSFVRAGLTHTSLMAFGLLAGGLGLTGEDEEERRRRRAAELQGAGFIYDPRKMANDFRNADGIWFGDSVFQPPWIAKQFLSPIMGIERFLDTGDTRHIAWGFQDAIGAFPIINTMTWHDAVSTGQDFAAMATEAGQSGDKEGLMQSHNLLTSMVGSYERMLFENAFVNQLYQASDRYDRDPYAQPLLDSDETVQVDAMGQPREATALRPYYDDQGKIKEGFIGRSSTSAGLHALTENRATLAGALSLFTGLGDSSFFRQNMAVKTRSFEAPLATDDQAKATIRSLVQSANGGVGMPNLTQEEGVNLLRNSGYGGKYARNADLEPVAAEMAASAGAAPLSVLDDAGREVLTKDGAKAVLRGLAKGSVTLESPALKGVHMTFDQRNEIAKEWMQDLIQEGVDMGLDETKATSRMKRLWYGPVEDPSVQGIGDILYTKDISYSDKLEYNQLNTTFVKGPDGLPWATGFGRSAVFGSVKFEKQIEPDKDMQGDYAGVMSVDERFNSVDLAANQNLGLRALEPVNEKIPTDVEIGQAIEKAIADAGQQSYTPFQQFPTSGGGGGGGYGRRGGGGYGGGGGGGYAPNIYFSKMQNLPEQRAPYADGIPFINTSNPILRRSDVRRERVWSERGRLKQWQ